MKSWKIYLLIALITSLGCYGFYTINSKLDSLNEKEAQFKIMSSYIEAQNTTMYILASRNQELEKQIEEMVKIQKNKEKSF